MTNLMTTCHHTSTISNHGKIHLLEKKDMHVQHFQYTALSRDDIAKALAKCNTLKTCENHGDLHKYKVSINRI